MGLFDFAGLTTEDIQTLVQLAQASYFPNDLPGVPGRAPPGWRTLVAADLNFQGGPVKGSFEGNYFVAGDLGLFDAAARIMEHRDGENGTILTVSFQGTDELSEVLLYPEIGGTTLYLNNFDALLKSVADYAAQQGIDEIWVTGHSLGAAAVNELNDLKDTAYGSAYANATYVSFATPEFFRGKEDILNIGFFNDPVFKSVDAGTFATATNNLLWYNSAYLYEEGQYGPNPSDLVSLLLGLLETHNIPNYIEGINRIVSSRFYDEMERDSFVIVDDYIGTVRALPDSPFFGEPTFFIGSNDSDRIIGGSAQDKMEGFDGNDKLFGMGGNDVILGGKGWDVLRGQQGDDELHGDAGKDRLLGGRGNDDLNGGADDDFLSGGRGNDNYIFDFSEPFGDDLVEFNAYRDSLTLIGSGLTRQQVADAYSEGFASGRFDFGASGSIEIFGIGINLVFSPDDVILIG